MRTIETIRYHINTYAEGLKLTIPAFNLSVNIPSDFQEDTLLSYLQ